MRISEKYALKSKNTFEENVNKIIYPELPENRKKMR